MTLWVALLTGAAEFPVQDVRCGEAEATKSNEYAVTKLVDMKSAKSKKGNCCNQQTKSLSFAMNARTPAE